MSTAKSYRRDWSFTGGLYTGETKGLEIEGLGSAVWNDGRSYCGEWAKGQFNGQGTRTFRDKTVQSGHFRNGKLNGQARTVFANGPVHTGTYENGFRNGLGTLTVPGEYTFQGEFINDSQHGFGKITYSDGTTYMGVFKNSKPHGFGCMVDVNGFRTVGSFVDGKPSGNCWTIDVDGTPRMASYVDGNLNAFHPDRAAELEESQEKINELKKENARLRGMSLDQLNDQELAELKKTIAGTLKRVHDQETANENRAAVYAELEEQKPEFRCPISNNLMMDPVTDMSGHTYDRSSIEKWFQQCKKDRKPLTSPTTNQLLMSDNLIPNHLMNSVILAEIDRLEAEAKMERQPKRYRPS